LGIPRRDISVVIEESDMGFLKTIQFPELVVSRKLAWKGSLKNRRVHPPAEKTASLHSTALGQSDDFLKMAFKVPAAEILAEHILQVVQSSDASSTTH
jgi:hypothetical protein